MYLGTLTWTKLILKFCYFPVDVPDTLSGKLRCSGLLRKLSSWYVSEVESRESIWNALSLDYKDRIQNYKNFLLDTKYDTKLQNRLQKFLATSSCRYPRVFHNFTTFEFFNDYPFLWWDFGRWLRIWHYFLIMTSSKGCTARYDVIFRYFAVSRKLLAIEAWGTHQMTQNARFPICPQYIIWPYLYKKKSYSQKTHFLRFLINFFNNYSSNSTY